MNRTIVALVAFAAVFGMVRTAVSHCEIPCGIYDDLMRIRMMKEDLATVEKSMKKIDELRGGEFIDWNQLVRWVMNKEAHADKVQEVVTQYFMTQRIKHPGDGDAKALAVYHERLSLLHRILVQAMKCKQTLEPKNVWEARNLVDEFAKSYFSAEDLKHLEGEHGGGK